MRASLFVPGFDPVQFFQGRTVGHAVAFGPTGAFLRRARIETQGEAAPDFEALHFDETYSFDDGSPVDVMHWAVRRRPDGGIDASELSVLGPVRSRMHGLEWRVRFSRRSVPPAKGPALGYDVSFVPLAEDLVAKRVILRLFGVPVARLDGHHRRV